MFQSYYNSSFHFTRPDYFEADDELYPPLLQRDLKPLLKQQLGNSPKRSSQNSAQARQRKVLYNFRKCVGDEGDMSSPQGVQRNNDNNLDGEEEQRDVFANFKFRRYPKPSNRNFNNANKRDKNVTWTLNPPTAITKTE